MTSNATNRAMASVYLEWAKLHSRARFNLATSGIMGYPLAALPVSLTDLEINGPDSYGYEPMKERIAAKHGIAAEQVFTTNGTSMANHMAMAAMLAPGYDVLIEHPTYGLLLEVASYLGANIIRFERHMEDNFQIDLDEIRAKITPRTRLIVLTNLHNPTGAFTDQATLLELGAIAASVDARVLIDEVYLDMACNLEPCDDRPNLTRSSIHLGDQFVVTSSLTKAYGLSGLRCGWVLADPDLTKRIWRLNDLFNATPVHPGELLSVVALENLPAVAVRARELLSANRRALDIFLKGRSDIEVFRPEAGTVCFPRFKHGSVANLCRLLQAEYETSVVPGEFFEMPQHFRIGIGGDPEMTAAGLTQLAKALDRIS